MVNFLTVFLIAIAIFVASHLSVDKDFPEKSRKNAIVVLVILAVVYMVFGVFLGGN